MRYWGLIANIACTQTLKFQINISTIESIASRLDYITIIDYKYTGTP